eukprot:TRINITY_DN12591_c6_g1_i1.p1 TRINITY_DN12591_c6_g1~~TRINITY_DN12591_c6_g1_i1.p1  ORF type:complete len:264 (+),score=42.23 TRINITY_DN12591_c6_g1_i1:46-792(+)
MGKTFAQWQRLMSRKSKDRLRNDTLFMSPGPTQLRLQPFGRQGFHEYRLVAMRTELDTGTGAPYEILGYFDPYARRDLHSPETPQAYDRMTYRKSLLDFDRIKWWLVKGATTTNEVQTLLSMAGLMPAPFSTAGHRHLSRFNWGTKNELYDYWLRTRPTPEQISSEERYTYYDGAPGQPTESGRRDLEREREREKIVAQLDSPQGIRKELLGTEEQRELARWQGPVGSLPRARFIQRGGPDQVFGREI